MIFEWIDELSSSDSRLFKENVLKGILSKAKQGEYEAQVFMALTRACYNPFVMFGVKQVGDTAGIRNVQNPWGEFNNLLIQLSKRELTGNSARDAIEEISYRFDSREWNKFCAPVIRRDLRVGISDKTINKICKGTEYEIPIFGCQLATNSEGRPELKGIKRLEPKLDGVRVILMVIPDKKGNVSAVSYSRNGKVFENFTHVENQIVENWPQFRGVSSLSDGFVLDGEMLGDTFQELMRQARRKKNVQADDSVFHVFDILPLEDFRRGYWNAQLSKRIALLDQLRNALDTLPNVELLPHIMVDLDTDEGRERLTQYANEQVNAGFEGIMVKAVDAPYECSRNTFWLKWKPVYDYDLTIIGVEEGTGKHAGRMGALVCEGMDSGKYIKVNVGSGYTDEERQSYWDDKDSVIGQTVVVLADAITQDALGNYSLRFPRFKCFREDK